MKVFRFSIISGIRGEINFLFCAFLWVLQHSMCDWLPVPTAARIGVTDYPSQPRYGSKASCWAIRHVYFHLAATWRRVLFAIFSSFLCFLSPSVIVVVTSASGPDSTGWQSVLSSIPRIAKVSLAVPSILCTRQNTSFVLYLPKSCRCSFSQAKLVYNIFFSLKIQLGCVCATSGFFVMILEKMLCTVVIYVGQFALLTCL